MTIIPRRIALLLATLTLAACSRAPQQAAPTADGAPPPTNRVDINANVRQNLGITFARAEHRSVAHTLRVPGRFELAPTARREYRLPAAGHVEIRVRQYQRVEHGQALFEIDSPRWRELQRELADALAGVSLAAAAVDSIQPFLDAHEKHHIEIHGAVDVWTARLAALEQLHAAGGASADELSQARASLASARAAFAETLEKEAELTVRRRESQAQLEAAKASYAILLESAASLTSLTTQDLASPHEGAPAWQSIRRLQVRAQTPGVIDSLHAVSGAFLEPSSLVLVAIQPEQLRFRAHALQSDLARLADDLHADVVPPQGGSIAPDQFVPGSITLAPTAGIERRTIEVVMTPDANAPLPETITGRPSSCATATARTTALWPVRG